MHSSVCGFIPSLISITRTAISAKFPPLFLKLLNAACPGESMKSKPLIVMPNFNEFNNGPQIFFIVSIGIELDEIF